MGGTMSETKISITRALKELKTLDARISQGISGLNVLDVTQNKYNGKTLKNNSTVEKFTAEVKAKNQALQDLIKRRNAIKSALVLSNATTKVKVGGLEMTVAEAIDQKAFVQYKKQLLTSLRTQKVQFDRELDQSRANMDRQIEVFMQQNLGKDKKVNSEEYNAIAKPFIEANELKLVDPINVGEVIKTLEEEVTTFEADIDIALSESNSKTEITLA
jgi:hypothetical protein